MTDDRFKEAELCVAAFSPLSAEQARALYAGYVKRGAQLRAVAEMIEVLRRATATHVKCRCICCAALKAYDGAE